jgi:hypothetical protein
MTAEPIRVSPVWLACREAADAAARATDLALLVNHHLADRPTVVIHDLGCGTGSMGRWLAPRLDGPQHWVLHDRDPDLLDRAARDLPGRAADGAPVTVETRPSDVAALTAADLAGADLVTASALLDLLTRAEVDQIVTAGAGAGCLALLTLSVSGRIHFASADPLDARFANAFNDHQRRTAGGRTLLGPDAVGAAADGFAAHGIATLVRSSPWRLGPDDGALMAEWFAGWLDAAVEQEPALAAVAPAYAQRRREEIAQRRLRVVVEHADLLAGRSLNGGHLLSGGHLLNGGHSLNGEHSSNGRRS